ncbi:MAG TPA: peptidase M18, partial [Thermoanaerobaculia bacterium]|nr:peptidase M18 [Thermoanaerobaculia bacterium]
MRKVSIAFLICSIAATLAAQDAKKPAGSVWDNRLSGWEQLQPGQKDEVFKFVEGYKSYLNVSRSALTSTKEVLRLAKAAGFSEFTDAAQVKPGARLIANAHDRALVLIIVGSDPLISGSRLVGTHHDSPHIDLKARPIYTSNGYTLFKTIYYGGIKKYQWANRPLALIGRIDTTDGKRVDVAIGLKEGDPVFVIPDNAPHSDNEGIRNRKAEDVFGGEELDPVVGSIPGKGDAVTAEVLAALTSTYGIREEDFVSAELQLVPNAVPADVGIDRGLVGAYGQDDRLSS